MPTDSEIQKDLVDVFEEAVDPATLDELLAICKIYALPPIELKYKYEAHLLALPHPASSTSTTTTTRTLGKGVPNGAAGAAGGMDLTMARELRRIVAREQQTGSGAGGAGGAGVGSVAGGGGGGGADIVGRGGGGASVRKAGAGGAGGRLAGFNGDISGLLETLATPTRSTLPRARPSGTGLGTSGSTTTIGRGGGTPGSAAAAAARTPIPRLEGGAAAGAGVGVGGVAGGRGMGYGNGNGNGNGLSPLVYNGSGSRIGAGMGMGINATAETPTSTLPASQRFHSRPRPNELLETLNAHLEPSAGLPFIGLGAGAGAGQGKGKQRVGLGAKGRREEWDYRYMFEKLSEKSSKLDMMIDDAAERFRDAYGIDELTDPSALSQDSTHVFGRIISTPTDTGKPSDSSLLLESSRAMGNGKRTPLRFAAQGVKVREGTPGVAGFGWFPGCLVGLKGRNGGGGAFEVEEVIMPPPLEMERTPLPDMLAMQERTGGQPVEVMLAAGPYTLDADLEYAPFEALVEAAIRDRPDVLLLLGPFVDSAHPLLKVGDTDLTPVQLFREHISSRLTALMESSPGTAVILIPSVRDLISRHVAFPQTPLDKDPELGLPKRVRMLPNPAHFYVNETLFSVASIDVLFHLRKEEYFRRAEEADAEPATGVVAPKDAMAELCRHVLGQRSMYPLVPPPADVAGEVNLDLAHHELLQLDVAPDVLILPSRLKYFAKIVDSVVAMNPGYLTKGNTAGTYSKLSIHPRRGAAPPADREKDGEEVEHEVYDRARVDVYRI